MKKLVAIVLSACLMFTIGGCIDKVSNLYTAIENEASDIAEVLSQTDTDSDSTSSKKDTDSVTKKTSSTEDSDANTEVDTDFLEDIDSALTEIDELLTDEDLEIMLRVQGGDYSLVTPEFKELMDEYERLVNKLLTASDEFSSDSDSDTIVDTIHNFVVTAKIFAEIADHTKDIKNIDLKNLSPADLSYMSLVLNRINEGFESRSNSSDTD